MDAMIAGLVPVVTSTESGTELLENDRNALICPVGNVDAISARLADLAKNRARIPQLGREAFQTARDYLTKLDYARNMREYLGKLQAARSSESMEAIR
jgi:glycosyltransferase involved in cell wall biosynthesis